MRCWFVNGEVSKEFRLREAKAVSASRGLHQLPLRKIRISPLPSLRCTELIALTNCDTRFRLQQRRDKAICSRSVGVSVELSVSLTGKRPHLRPAAGPMCSFPAERTLFCAVKLPAVCHLMYLPQDISTVQTSPLDVLADLEAEADLLLVPRSGSDCFFLDQPSTLLGPA